MKRKSRPQTIFKIGNESYSGKKIPRLVDHAGSTPAGGTKQKGIIMKSLFNKYEAYTKEGSELSDEAYKLIEPLIEKWAQKNYKIRDIGEIVSDSVQTMVVFSRIEKAIKMRIQEKKQQQNKPK